MTILLIRHAESESNVDYSALNDKIDPLIEITKKGKLQALAVAKKCSLYEKDFDIYFSPYLRTRQTAEIIAKELGASAKESMFLAEQQFGCLYTSGIREYSRKFPEEYHNYEVYKNASAKFWAKNHMGESKFDLCLRSAQLLASIDQSRDIILVTHGGNVRAIQKEWCGYDVEWFSKQGIPDNCSIVELRGRG